jgi:hypothetical protein
VYSDTVIIMGDDRGIFFSPALADFLLLVLGPLLLQTVSLKKSISASRLSRLQLFYLSVMSLA